MLQPKQTKFRKMHKGRNRGLAQNGNTIAFGRFGLVASGRGRVTARQIEAARRAMTRYIKRGGNIWIRIFPDKPITKKPLEVRMGKGKGNVEYWVALVQPGKVMFEMAGVEEEQAREAFRLASAKLPVKTHFIKRLNQREQLIKKVKIIPVELVVRNLAAGSIVKRYAINEGVKFSKPLIEFFYKNDSLNDPLLNEQHIKEFGWSDNNEIKLIKKEALRINKILIKIFDKAGIDLVDFKIEFGHCFNKQNEKQIILADEISPDNCRLWDIDSNKKLDKDRYRDDLGGLLEAYLDVSRRLGIKKVF